MGKFVNKIKENIKDAAEVRKKRAQEAESMRKAHRAVYQKELLKAKAREATTRAKADARRDAKRLMMTRSEKIQSTARNISKGANDLSKGLNDLGNMGFDTPKQTRSNKGSKKKRAGSRAKKTTKGFNDFDVDFDFDFDF